MLFTPAIKPGTCKKFAKLNKGPFRIIEKISRVNFHIQSVSNPDHFEVVHVDRLSKITERITFPAWPTDTAVNIDREDNGAAIDTQEQVGNNTETKRKTFVRRFPLVNSPRGTKARGTKMKRNIAAQGTLHSYNLRGRK